MAFAIISPQRMTRTHIPLFLKSLLHTKAITTSLNKDPNLTSLLTLIFQSKPNPSLTLLTQSKLKPTKELVCSALHELKYDCESSILVFKWARKCVEDCEKAWNMMVWVMGNGKRFDLAWSLVRRMHRKKLLNKEALLILIERYAASNDVGKAIKTFHAMEKFKIDVDSATFYELLRALCKNKHVEEAEEFLLLNQKFYPLETEGFNIILDGYCNIIVDLVEAKRVWREMSNYCIIPDNISYSHIIHCSSKAGNLCDSLRLYDQMKTRGWVPGLTVYNSLIHALTRENCLKEAQKVFDKFLQVGLNPNIETYNSMICPLCDAHKLDEAWKLMEEMTVNNIHPTIETYRAFVKAEDIEGTLNLLKRMKCAGYDPDNYTFLLIFEKFLNLDQSENALRMWSEMEVYNVVPDSLHYTTLVQGLVTHGWIPKAMEFYNEMKSKGFPSDPKFEKLFETYILSNKNHWGKGGRKLIIAPVGKRNPSRIRDVRVHQEIGKMIF